ncbi:MAG: hypothetical protein E6Y63_06755 [Haemophilus parainfluenzae]|jgi:hypothetical protein|uniref:hypothetical protein n=1 Tax=uncultured Haemophilus sp. TaxID=237779 RepID=UPI0028045864|nr:hypothetical protein [uncultured Haemophilus sp.]MDU4566135.1 hypothetical protein [Haemophilus parainfluenzae]MDU4637784.1 hypothetical protein [Haemophilus parainfluenzae]MDU5990772.1 hypothetical protein [Haemophilus parainfluenzae]
MEGKNRNDLVFELYYSYNLENLFYHCNARLNNLFTVVQLLLSSAIIGDLSSYTPPSVNINIIIGLILAVLSALSLVYRFGEKAVSARIGADRYSALIHRHSKMTDDELADVLLESNSLDNHITGVFADIAYKRSAIQLNLQDDTKLTCYQSFIAKFCGEKF